MKIGILTFHRSLNYGAELQAIALMTFLCDLGHDATIIDYWPDYRTQFWKETFSRPPIQMLRAIELRIMTMIRYHIRKCRSERFIDSKMKFSPMTDEYDVVIYGSDQIWRKFDNRVIKGFDVVYWGDDRIKAKYRISYAASMGSTQILNGNDNSFISKHLRLFDALSCREQDLIDYCESHFCIKIAKVLDPVFLLSSNQWNSLLPITRVPSFDFILFYTTINNKALEQLARSIHKETGLPIIEVRGSLVEFHYGKRYWFTANAGDFVSLIRKATYVVASSFHGVALSLRFNKEFYYIGDIKSANRIRSLLSELDLVNRIVNEGQYIDFTNRINWPDVNEKLNVLENQSKDWLRSHLLLFSSNELLSES